MKADEIIKRISEDYPDNWLRVFEFLCFPTDEQLKEHLIRAIGKSSPQRVLVVGGVHLFESLHAGDLPAFNICVNTIHDLGWLCEFCKYVRNNHMPSIVVSNFPRKYALPTVRFVVGPNYVGKVGTAVGTAGGRWDVHKTVAPPDSLVALCEEKDQKTTMSIFFYGVHALSYYHDVLKSQHRRPDQLLMCTVLTAPDDNNLSIKQQETLKVSHDHTEQRRILIEASETWELLARVYDNDPRYIENTGYSGGVLSNFTVPKKIPSRRLTSPTV